MKITAAEAISHAAAALAGLALAWFVISEAWIDFDSIVPMWIAGFITSAIAVGLVVWRPRRFLGLSAGLLVSAVICTGFFTLISSGPAMD